MSNKKTSLFDQLKAGLEDSIACSRGELTLRTTELPGPAPSVSPKEVQRIRGELGMSQAYFAAVLNVSPKTIQSWEQGLREPSDAALRIIQIVRAEPERVQAVVQSGQPTTRAAAKRGPTRSSARPRRLKKKAS